MKALIVYGTRYGATEGTSQEIAKVLRNEGLEVKVVNAREEKIKDIIPFELVIVGTGIQMSRWVGEVEDFLKSHQSDLSKKKVALFVSTMKMVSEREGKIEDLAKARKMELDDKLGKYNLEFLSVGFFGGVMNFNKMNIIARKAFGSMRARLEKDGFKEVEPGLFELRDWEEIRGWAKELALKSQS
jgi:menaquinone-dependent protoporphyrinogen oxidase